MHSTSLSNNRKYVILACIFCIVIIATLLYYGKDSKNTKNQPSTNISAATIKDSTKSSTQENYKKTDSRHSKTNMQNTVELNKN